MTITISSAEGGGVAAWLTFVAMIITAAAWPLAACFIIYLLRVEVRALIQRVKALGFGGATAELNDQLTEAETLSVLAPSPRKAAVTAAINEVEADTPVVAPGKADGMANAGHWVTDDAAFQDLVRIDPRIAISHQWTLLQAAIYDKGKQNGVEVQPSFEVAIVHLANVGLIDSRLMTLLNQIATLAYSAQLQRGPIAASDAVRFRSLTAEAMRRLTLTAPPPPPPPIRSS